MGQDGCIGNQRRFEPCSESACIQWTDWSDWGVCDKKCGDGKMTRYRKSLTFCSSEIILITTYCTKLQRDCMNARLGLPGCEGDRIEERECEDLPQCDLLGQWSQERLKKIPVS